MRTKLIVLAVLIVLRLALPTHAENGSLWGQNNRPYHSMFSDPVACNIGDLITIIVNLSTATTKDKDLNTAKQTSVDDEIVAVGYNRPTGGQSNGDYDWFRYRDQNPAFNWSSDHQFKGGGTLKDSETLVTTLQARVTDVLPNGSLQIEARRNFEAGKEKSIIVLTGVVRREDLDSSNSISSTKVADLQIKQEGTGPLSRSQRKGWLTTLYEILCPF